MVKRKERRKGDWMVRKRKRGRNERPSFKVNKVNKERGSYKESKRIGSEEESERERRMLLRTLIRADNQAE